MVKVGKSGGGGPLKTKGKRKDVRLKRKAKSTPKGSSPKGLAPKASEIKLAGIDFRKSPMSYFKAKPRGMTRPAGRKR